MRIDWHSFKEHWTRPPKNQFPTGTMAFKGHQGMGKTLSIVKYVFDLQKEFPNCLIYSNVKINGLQNFHYYSDTTGLNNALGVANGDKGVVVIIDEAHLYLGKKTGIPLDVLTAISQQRKDRRRIIISSQIWEDLDISLRKQVPDIVSCSTFLRFIQINRVYNGHTLTWSKLDSAYVADKKYTYIFKHFDILYNSYDTYQKIITNDEYSSIATSTPALSVSIDNSKPTKSFNRVFHR